MSYLESVQESFKALAFDRFALGDIISKESTYYHVILTYALTLTLVLTNYIVSTYDPILLIGLPLFVSVGILVLILEQYFMHSLAILFRGDADFASFFAIDGNVKILLILAAIPEVGFYIAIPTILYLYLYRAYIFENLYGMETVGNASALAVPILLIFFLLYYGMIGPF